MYRGYKVKMYPNEEQKQLLDKQFGCARWVYNEMIKINQKKYHRTGRGLSGYDMQSYLPKLKKQYPWLAEANASSLQIVCHNLAEAYGRFFKKQAGYPKSKKLGQDSFTTINGSYFVGNKVRLPKIGRISFRGSQIPEGKVKNLTISKSAGNYYCSALIEISEAPNPKKPKNILGIDLGLKDLITTSVGESIPCPKRRLSKTAAQSFSRKVRGSKARSKAKLVLSKAHRKIKNQRRDHNHKITSILIADSENQAFAMEDLNVKGMMANHKLARSIADAGWYQFKTFLTYKALAVGKPVLEVGRFYPSSKTCSACGLVNQNLTLSMREWSCGCGAVHQRDVNAARNIALEAARNSARGGNVNPETLLRKVNVVEARSLVIPRGLEKCPAPPQSL